MKKYDTLVKGGLVVSPSKIESHDIAIKDEKVVAVEPEIPENNADRVIDASKLLVMPGALDAHYHPQYGDNLAQGSIAAAHGGITTLVPFIYAYQDMHVGQAIDDFLATDGSESVLDFGGHVAILDPPLQLGELGEAFDRGITSFKLFMAYRRRGMMSDDDMLLGAMEYIGEHGGLTMVHAENGLGVDYLEQKFQAEGKVSIEWFERSRPKRFEYEAVNRAILLAATVESPLYLVHQTTGEAVSLIEQAREDGQFVVGETCPQYLTHTKDVLVKQGPLAICTPPYREQWDVDTLWDGVADGAMSTVGSDHSPHPRETKLQDNVFKTPVGTPQVETMASVMFHRGVVEGRMTPQRFVAVMCENPARVFGLYPRKGTIQVGSDADILMIDPSKKWRVSSRDLHSSVDYNTYDGMELVGMPVHSLQRGHDVLVHGELKVDPGDGGHIRVEPGIERPV